MKLLVTGNFLIIVSIQKTICIIVNNCCILKMRISTNHNWRKTKIFSQSLLTA